jgi:hypothetical protein
MRHLLEHGCYLAKAVRFYKDFHSWLLQNDNVLRARESKPSYSRRRHASGFAGQSCRRFRRNLIVCASERRDGHLLDFFLRI